MPNIKEYFDKNRYKPTYFLGDRVRGKWNKIPFVGTILIDHLVSEDIGPVIRVFSDLPIKYKNTYYNVIEVDKKNLHHIK